MRRALVAVRAVVVHRATSAAAMIVSVLGGTFVVKDKVVAHLAPHVVPLLLDVVRARTLNAVTEGVVPPTPHVVLLEAVVTPIHRFVAPMVSPAGKQLQTVRLSGRGGEASSDYPTISSTRYSISDH